MIIKRITAVLLIAVTAAALFSCGGSNEAETDAAETSAETESAAQYGGDTAALKTENFTVTKAELSYIAYINYRQFSTNYAAYLAYYGLDTSKSLREQKCSFDGYDTWYDYFIGNAKNYAAETLSGCEAAREAGVTLTDSERGEIDEAAAVWEREAAAAGADNTDEYIRSNTGCEFTVDAMKSFTEKTYLSSKYFNDVINAYEVTDEEIAAYYIENEDSFKYIDYLAYTFYTDSDTDAASHAAELAAITDAEGFRTYVESYIGEVFLSSVPEEEKPAKQENIMSSVVNIRRKKGSGEFYDWAFSSESAGAGSEEGKVYTVSDEENGSFVVYLLTAAPYRIDTAVRTYRDVKLTKNTCGTYAGAVEKAEELLAGFGGGEDAFAAIAKEYSEDADTKFDGGLVKNVCTTEVSPDEVEAWLFDGERVEGDTAVVKSNGECHLVYYSGEGLPKWKNDVREAIKYSRYTSDVEALAERYPVTSDDAVINDVTL